MKNKMPTSRGFFYRDVILNTTQAYRAFHRTYEYLCQRFYYVALIAIFQGDPDEAEQTEAQMSGIMMQLGKSLTDEKARLDTIRTNTGMTKLPTYDNPQKIRAAMRSPYDARYLQIIVDLDEIVMHIDSLQKIEEIHTREKNNEPYRWQQMVIKRANEIGALSDRLRSKNMVSA